MNEFNEENWQEALSGIYTRSVFDDSFRQLCLSDPKAAVAAVSDIELPDWFKFNFVGLHHDIFYSYFLPPSLGLAAPTPEQTKQLIDWKVYCTDPMTH